jgi:endoglucanase
VAAVLQVKGERIVDAAGRPVLLRGIAFGNQVWTDVLLPRQHHAEVDYERVANMGMNAVRFYLNAKTFEDPAHPGVYEPAGWAWLDDNVRWAKAHGVYLVLNMHVPPGGYQSLGEGKGLWTDPEAAQRFVDLWVAIAGRYRGEPTIAGYDLLNEPVITERPSQWHELAERTISAVRAVDPGHMIFVERVNGAAGNWGEDDDRNFFRVGDPNVVYEFHFYRPFAFTHQNAEWAPFAAESSVYPDPNGVGVEFFNLTWEAGTEDNPALPAGDSDWHEYPGSWFTVKNPKLAVAQTTMRVSRVGQGKAYFDALVLEEREASGKVTRRVDADLSSARGWFFWTRNQSGKGVAEKQGHGDDDSLSVEGTTDEAAFVSDPLRFQPKQGSSYRIGGWMKGQGIPSDARCQIRLNFFSSKVPVYALDKNYLAAELDGYERWGKRERVPLYLGEWGTIRQSFEGDRGGLRWAEDMLDLILERDLSFAFHDYHEEQMGLYRGDGSLPSPENANKPLIELFTRKLRGAR